MDNSVIDILKFQNYVNIFERVVLSWIFQFFELNRILFVYRITRKQWIERESMRNIFIFQNRYSLWIQIELIDYNGALRFFFYFLYFIGTFTLWLHLTYEIYHVGVSIFYVDLLFCLIYLFDRITFQEI